MASIATKTGDTGSTSLLFGRRVAKSDPRIECNGSVDELNAALGMARAHLSGGIGDPWVTTAILEIQKTLVVLMGEVATAPADRDRHAKAGFGAVRCEQVDELTSKVDDLEKNHRISFKRWATPGDTLASAALDVARTVCRRAERNISVLSDTDGTFNLEILRYLNRLSDLIWLWARWVETNTETITGIQTECVESTAVNTKQPTNL